MRRLEPACFCRAMSGVAVVVELDIEFNLAHGFHFVRYFRLYDSVKFFGKMDCLWLGFKDSILKSAVNDDDLAPRACLRLMRLEQPFGYGLLRKGWCSFVGRYICWKIFHVGARRLVLVLRGA